MRLPRDLRLRALLAVAIAGVSAARIATATRCTGTADRPLGGAITPPKAPRFSDDALVLAARIADGPWLCARDAAKFDRDLRRIRHRFPFVADVHAGPDFVLDQAEVAVDTGAPWLAAWTAGGTGTGTPRVDRVLHRFRARAAAYLFTSEGTAWFVLTFSGPLAVPAMLPALRSTSPHFRTVAANTVVGDGDRITAEGPGHGVYTFSRGFGDCAAGCTARHFWEFRLSRGGTIAVREYGDPLPPSSAQGAGAARSSDGNLF